MNRKCASMVILAFIIFAAIGGVLWWYGSNNGFIAMNTNTTHPFFALTSPAFVDGAIIPAAYTCDADNDLSPPLAVVGVPDGARSLALIMDDPDIPQAVKDSRGIEVFDHWVLFNIPPTTSEIPEGGFVGVAGANSVGGDAYYGPCPPPQYEPSEHRYIFTLYALDTMLDLQEGATKSEVLAAMQGHILAQAQLVGKYKRK